MYRKSLVFAAACLGMLIFGVVFSSLGSVNNMLARRFGLDNSSLGTLTALLPLGILAGSLVFGPVVDRFGYRWMLVAAALVVGAAMEGLALADNRSLVQLCVFLLGLGGGVLNGATNALAADVSEGQRSSRLSLLGVFFGVGALAMPSALAALSRHYSLSSVTAGVGATVLAPVAYWLAIQFPPPKQRSSGLAPLRGFRLLGHPFFLLACLAMAIQSGMEGMSVDWIPRYLEQVKLSGDVDADWKSLIGLSSLIAAMMATRVALAALLKRAPAQVILLTSVVVAALGVTALKFATNYSVSLAAAAAIGAGLAAAFPIVLGYVGDLYPQDSGAAFSAIFTVALLGNMVVNKTFGQVAQRFGVAKYSTMMLICLACSAALLAAVVWQLRRTNQLLRTTESPGAGASVDD